MLAEATTTELTRVQNPQSLPENQQVAREGGAVAGNARKDIEERTGKSVITAANRNQLGAVVAGLMAGVEEKDEKD